jgi:sugar phosphate isomerase/epimerase
MQESDNHLTPLPRDAQPASAIFPGIGHRRAVAAANTLMLVNTGAPAQHMQLCPQHPGLVDETLVDELRQAWPETQFRPHASVRVEGARPASAAASWAKESTRAYFKRLAELAHRMGAPAYSVHAGKRSETEKPQVLEDNLSRIQDAFGDIPVAVEGLWARHSLISTWSEYEWLYQSGLNYALDLSHVHIVVGREGRRDELVSAMLASPHCLEIHISGNDGRRDSHGIARSDEWWWSLLSEADNPDAIVFDEGIRARPRRH